jgi:dihydrodipicolinate synthase/N-acetylneuraminate lyase
LSTVAKRVPATMLATCPLPWTAQGELDARLFQQTVAEQAAGLTPNLYVFGTAGEGHAVTDTQFRAVVDAFRAALPAGTSPMVGVISLSLGTTIERIAWAREVGVRDFQLSLPAWGALTDREVDSFFAETCGRFRDCRFLHYNLARVKRVLNGDDYARLAATHPNLISIKMGGQDVAAMEAILTKAPALQCFFTEFGYAELRDRFECGLLVSISSVHWEKSRRFFAARGEELARMRDELRGIHRSLIAAVGNEAHMDGAYDKLYVKLHAPDFPLRLLPPYASTSEETFRRFRDALPAEWRSRKNQD